MLKTILNPGVLLLPAAMTLFACAADPVHPVAPSGDTSTSGARPDSAATAKGDDTAPTQLNIDDKIRTACGIAASEAYFAFNSANVKQGDYPVLTKLADCFRAGPLKGQKMLLVGHADSRGDDDYNMTLGGRRAGGVKQVLTARKLSATQVVTSSRGEMDATGEDEAAYAADRRVDVRLAD